VAVLLKTSKRGENFLQEKALEATKQKEEKRKKQKTFLLIVNFLLEDLSKVPGIAAHLYPNISSPH
jgi:hypothetical protein